MEQTVMKENLDKFIGQMVVMLQDAKTFAEREIPIFMKEILEYGMYKNILLAICFAASSIVCVKIILLSTKKLNKPNSEDAHLAALAALTVSCIILMFSLPLFVMRIEDIIKIYFAPRLYLVEFMKNIVCKH